MSAKKIYFAINFIQVINKACQILASTVSHCHCLHLCGQCLNLPHAPNIPILFTAIPQHIIISPIHCIGYTALVKTLHSHFWRVALPLTKYYIHISWFRNLTWTHEEDSWISLQVVLVVLRILNTCVLDFCVVSVVWSIWVNDS